MRRVSVIIPCYNEAGHVDELVANLIAQDYSKKHLEIIFADGGSTDGTWEKLVGWKEKHSFIEIIENPDKYVSHALNACIRQSTGEIIVRMDAHSVYPPDYISVLTSKLIELNADNTGGVWITEPADASAEARAIALATSHPLGIGNASYRLGSDEEKQVDTVPYGCFKRELFDRIGFFDEDLIRNQDDEFNGRIIREGGSVWLIPKVKIRYFARPTRSKLSQMFYQYGFFKPLVNRKLGAPATLRQFVPLLMVLSGLAALILAFVQPTLIWVFVCWFAVYFFSVLLVSLTIAARSGWLLLFDLIFTFPTIHISYGFGYLAGLMKWMLFKSGKVRVSDSR